MHFAANLNHLSLQLTTKERVSPARTGYDRQEILIDNYLLYNLRVLSRSAIIEMSTIEMSTIEMSTMDYNNTPAPVIGETDDKAKTRLLLTLWALGGSDAKIKKSELTSKVKQKRQGKKVGVSQGLYDELKTAGAIGIEKENQVPMVSMTHIGKQMLVEALRSPEFEFEGTVVAARMANGLVELIREIEGGIRPERTPEQTSG